MRTPLHKCDVTYVVSPAYKGGRGSKSPEILRTYNVHAPLVGGLFRVIEVVVVGVSTRARNITIKQDHQFGKREHLQTSVQKRCELC